MACLAKTSIKKTYTFTDQTVLDGDTAVPGKGEKRDFDRADEVKVEVLLSKFNVSMIC